MYADYIRLCYNLLKESSYRDSEFYEYKLKELVDNKMTCCYLYKSDGIFKGFILGHLSTCLWNNDIAAEEVFLYVEPVIRGSSAAIKLIYQFETWAKENKAKIVRIGQSSSVDIEKTAKFYKKLGYEITGCTTRKEIRHECSN
jgi:GNAT superfamily N-acetyltransferase